MKRIHAVLTILTLSVLFGAACANNSYGSAQITQIEGSADAVIDFRAGITIPEGVAVSANIQLLAVDGNALSGNLQSEDPSILVVSQSASNTNDYVFQGVSAGKTSVSVTANGNQVAIITATVSAASKSAVAAPKVMAGTTVGPDADVVYSGDAGRDATVDGSEPSRDAGPNDVGTGSEGGQDAGNVDDAHKG
jgi:hypothetical protein